MNQELKDAIKRFVDAANEWADKWDAVQALCEVLELLVPGFVCPWAQTARPTIAEMTTWVDSLSTLYPDLFPEGEPQ